MRSSFMKPLLAGALVFALSMIAYSNSFHAEFHLDDYHQVMMNEHVQDIGNAARFFTDATLASHYPQRKVYRPVTILCLAVVYRLSGQDVFGYHVLNFALHIINAVFVYLVAGMVVRAAGREDFRSLPLLTALVFAVHPVQTGAVTYISGVALLLAAFFCLFGLYAFLRSRAGGRGQYAWVLLSAVLYFLGLLSKEMAVCLIGLMFLYDIVFTMPKTRGFSGWARAGLGYLPHILALLLYLVLKTGLQGSLSETDMPLGVREYMMSEAKVALLYMRILFFPVNQNADYNMPWVESLDIMVVVAVIFWTSAAYLLWAARKSHPLIAFFGLWSFVTLAPESTLVPIPDIAVEYRLYLPLAGFAATLIAVLSNALKNASFRMALAAGVVVLFCVLTYARNSVWATEYTLWKDVVRKSPLSGRAHTNYGSALGERDYEAASREINEGMRLIKQEDEWRSKF